MDAPGAGWQSGYAADCKSVYAGSIPASASSFAVIWRSRAGAALARRHLGTGNRGHGAIVVGARRVYSGCWM